MGEDEDHLDPFSAAENVAHLVIDQVVQEGGKLLYDSYIAHKSFLFAAEATCEVLLGEMKMHFVRYDQGEGQQQLVRQTSYCRPATGSKADMRRPAEDDVSSVRGLPRPGSAPATTNERLASAAAVMPTASILDTSADGLEPGTQASRDGWCMESEPSRCRIDTWARACVPVRRVSRQKVASNGDYRKHHASNGSVSVPSSRSPSRFGTHAVAEGAEVGLKSATSARYQMIPLVIERQEDEEEAMLRDMKEREARKHREEQQRTERKAAEEEAAKLVQVKDDKKKQFAYDSEGNVIVVQPPQVHRLPNPIPAMAFVLKEDASQELRVPAEKRAPRARDKLTKGKRRDSDFKDGVKKFASQQPSMMEAMMMSPGVELEERNRTKRGEKAKVDPGTMSRKEYEEIARGGMPPNKTGSKAVNTPPLPAPAVHKSLSGRLGSVDAAPGSEGPQESPDPAKNVRAEVGSDSVKAPVPPKAPRPLQPSPPSARNRVESRRDALGFSLAARERIRVNAGSRFPDCAPQPPLGATMGHGLFPHSSKDQEFYFPGATSALESDLMDMPPPKEQFQDQIVSKNAQLKRRLFEGR